MAITRLMTIEEFAAITPADGQAELIEGEVREVGPAGGRHGEHGSEFHMHIGGFAKYHDLGKTYTSDTGFILARGERPTVVMTDVAFVRKKRLPPAQDREGYMPVVPDLAVEVVSPTDRMTDIHDKIEHYMAAEVPILWVAFPRSRSVSIHSPGLPTVIVDADGVLDGGEVLPGLRIRVADIFAE